MTRDAEFAKPIRDRYATRIVALLRQVQAVARASGYTFRQGPTEATYEEYRWEMVGRRPGGRGDEDLVDFSFTIAEAAAYGDDPDDGINFTFDIVDFGGHILGGITPYNYTSQVWVPAGDAAGVEERFRLIESADLSTLGTLL